MAKDNNFVIPFLLFVFAMALGEDCNILLMSRIRKEAHGAALGEALTRAIGLTGGTITSAGIILGGTFAVLALAGNTDQARQFGFTIAFAVFLDTFFVRTLLVPSIAVLLGRWNWWPSRLFHGEWTAVCRSTWDTHTRAVADLRAGAAGSAVCWTRPAQGAGRYRRHRPPGQGTRCTHAALTMYSADELSAPQ